MILVADNEINEKYKILYHFCFLTSYLVLGEHQYSHDTVFWGISRRICLILDLNWDFRNDFRDLGRPFHQSTSSRKWFFSFFLVESTQHNNVGLMQTWFYSYVHRSLFWTCLLDYLEKLGDKRHASKNKKVKVRDLVCWRKGMAWSVGLVKNINQSALSWRINNLFAWTLAPGPQAHIP